MSPTIITFVFSEEGSGGDRDGFSRRSIASRSEKSFSLFLILIKYVLNKLSVYLPKTFYYLILNSFSIVTTYIELTLLWMDGREYNGI